MITKAIVAVIFLAIGALPVMAAGTTLSPDEIKATFGTGKPFTAASTSGKAFSLTLKADGSALEMPKGKKSGRKGTWRVSDKGYCSTWGTNNEHCYTVQKNGTKYDVLDSGRHIIAIWTP
jgi:hypothetical protein